MTTEQGAVEKGSLRVILFVARIEVDTRVDVDFHGRDREE
jgi:hypothetical protein